LSTKNARSTQRKKLTAKAGSRPGSPWARRRVPGRQPVWIWALLGVAIAALAVIYLSNRGSSASSGGSYAFQVGDPSQGPAPNIKLASSNDGTFDLASMRGKTVLLYFQEGLTCQPCWDQLRDIQNHFDRFKAIGIDRVVSITTDPIDQIKQKVADDGITEPVLSDPDLTVSQSYHANSFGMMGDSRDGHTFIVVGPDGTILWRADYGGAPDYTMYLPVASLLTDIQRGLKDGG
jgi:peroxiredoxin